MFRRERSLGFTGDWDWGGGCRRCPVAELGMKLGIQFGGAEDLQLAYLPPWPEWSISSQGVPAGVGMWDKEMSDGREVRKEDLCSLLERGLRIKREASEGALIQS